MDKINSIDSYNIYSTSSGTNTIDNCRFTNNQTHQDGNIYVENGTINLNKGTFNWTQGAGNKSTYIDGSGSINIANGVEIKETFKP